MKVAEKSPDEKTPKEYEVSRDRWLTLGTFVMLSAANGMQWIEYTIIQDTVVKYYGVTTSTVYWTAMVYSITYIPFIFPASWLMEKSVSFCYCFISVCGLIECGG